MTTTVLTTYEAPYNVGRRHVFFDLRSSTPTSGDVDALDAIGEFVVIRSGAKLYEKRGGFDFSWIGLNADQVKARYTDAAGNAGDWETYTFSATANTSADVVLYVDGATGSDGDPGTEAEPLQTVSSAITAARAALTSGQVGVIFVAGDQTYTFSATAWVGGTTARLIRFIKWNGTNNPVFEQTGASRTMFATGDAESVQAEGIDLLGWSGTIASGTYGLDLTQTGATKSPPCSYLMDCTVSRFNITIGSGGSDTADKADKEAGWLDFVGCDNVDMNVAAHYHVYGLIRRRYVHMRKLIVRDTQNGSGNNFWRQQLWANHYCDDIDVQYANASANIRIQGGDFAVVDEDDVSGPGTWHNVEFVADADIRGIHLESDSPGTNLAVHRSIRFIDCVLPKGGFFFQGDNSGAGIDCNKIDLIRCHTYSAAVTVRHMTTPATLANVRKVRGKNCITYGLTDAARRFLEVGYGPTLVSDGAFEFKGCVAHQPAGNAGGSKRYYNFSAMTRDQAAAKFAVSDYNIYGKDDTTAPSWCGGSDGTDTLAQWQSRTTFDDNSQVVTNATDALLLTTLPNTTTGGGADARLASTSSPLYENGPPVAYAIDGDGFLRDATTPDAGPFEYGASTLPDDPEISSGSAGYRSRRRMGLRRGLR